MAVHALSKRRLGKANTAAAQWLAYPTCSAHNCRRCCCCCCCCCCAENQRLCNLACCTSYAHLACSQYSSQQHVLLMPVLFAASPPPCFTGFHASARLANSDSFAASPTHLVLQHFTEQIALRHLTCLLHRPLTSSAGSHSSPLCQTRAARRGPPSAAARCGAAAAAHHPSCAPAR